MTEPKEELWAVSVRAGTPLMGGKKFTHHVLATSEEEALARYLKEWPLVRRKDVLEVGRSRDDEMEPEGE